MRVTQDLHEFFDATKMIFDHGRLWDLGLEVTDFFGTIWPSEIENARRFCERCPAFHIVSYVGEGVFLNRYDARGSTFYLAEGDSDPAYVLDSKEFHDQFYSSLSRGSSPHA